MVVQFEFGVVQFEFGVVLDELGVGRLEFEVNDTSETRTSFENGDGSMRLDLFRVKLKKYVPLWYKKFVLGLIWKFFN